MNIVYLEGRLEGINSIKRGLIGSKEEYRFDMEYYKVYKRLTELTGNLSPKALKEKLFKQRI